MSDFITALANANKALSAADLIRVTLGASKVFAAEMYGAISDGTVHPVSEWLAGGARSRGYANLAAIQAAYPHVTSLTDTIDWAAAQEAVRQMKLAGGGDVRLYGTSYRFNRTLKLPLRTIYTSQSGYEFTLRGNGLYNTSIRWTNENNLEYAISFETDGVIDDLIQSHSYLENLRLYGPDHNAPAKDYSKGATTNLPTSMLGVQLIDRVHTRNVSAQGFYAGATLEGGQAVHTELEVGYACKYGLYLKRRNQAHHGDLVFIKSTFQGKVAGISLGPDTGLLFTKFVQGGFFFSHTAVLKEEGTGTGSHANSILGEVNFDRTQVERVACLILEDNATPSKDVVNTVMTNCQLMYDAATIVSGYSTDATINVGNIFGLEVRKPNSQWFVGDTAFLKAITLQNILIDNADTIINQLTSTKLLAKGATEGDIELRGNGWSGRGFVTDASGGTTATTKGDLMTVKQARINRARSAPVGEEERVVGVAMASCPTGAWLPVATQGKVSVKFTGTLGANGAPIKNAGAIVEGAAAKAASLYDGEVFAHSVFPSLVSGMATVQLIQLNTNLSPGPVCNVSVPASGVYLLTFDRAHVLASPTVATSDGSASTMTYRYKPSAGGAWQSSPTFPLSVALGSLLETTNGGSVAAAVAFPILR